MSQQKNLKLALHAVQPIGGKAVGRHDVFPADAVQSFTFRAGRSGQLGRGRESCGQGGECRVDRLTPHPHKLLGFAPVVLLPSEWTILSGEHGMAGSQSMRVPVE
jgi:hypothetical protein